MIKKTTLTTSRSYEEIIQRAQALNLPAGSYVVFGSGPLAAHGIRESSDLDIVVTSELYKELKGKGWEVRQWDSGEEYLVKGDVEADDSWNYGDYNPSPEELMQKAEVIDGIPFAPVEEVYKWKKAFGRDKDKKDLDLISKWIIKKIILSLDNEALSLLCKAGLSLPAAGNVGIFCRNDEEYDLLIEAAKSLTLSSDNPNQKYFRLIEPISSERNKYEWLYVRKPAEDSPERGDIDFLMDVADYEALKEKIKTGNLKGVSIYDRPGWDMVEIKDPNIDSLAYICTREMAEKVRIRF